MIRYIFITVLIFACSCSHADDVKLILHDKCINELYMPASVYFMYDGIYVIRDSRGIILRFNLKNPLGEYSTLSSEVIQKIAKIESFLSKIKNLAIIEVHIEETLHEDLKNWEVSSVIASNIENNICNLNKQLKERIKSVGYGEFLPVKNTPNNGGNFLNRVDIIILCNISGE